MLLNLAGCCCGHLGEDFELLRKFVRSEASFKQSVLHGRKTQFRSRPEHDACAGSFTKPRIGECYDGDTFDLGKGKDEVFDLSRRNVESASYEDLLHAADDSEVLIRIDE